MFDGLKEKYIYIYQSITPSFSPPDLSDIIWYLPHPKVPPSASSHLKKQSPPPLSWSSNNTCNIARVWQHWLVNGWKKINTYIIFRAGDWRHSTLENWWDPFVLAGMEWNLHSVAGIKETGVTRNHGSGSYITAPRPWAITLCNDRP